VNQPLKLLFDECIGGPLIAHFAALIAYTPVDCEVKLVLDYVASGVHDQDWIPKIADEGWIIVTGDSGKGGTGKGQKLPHLCTQLGVTHIMLSGKLQQKKGFEKVRAIISVWEEICELPAQPKGSAWVLRFVGSGRNVALQQRK